MLLSVLWHWYWSNYKYLGHDWLLFTGLTSKLFFSEKWLEKSKPSVKYIFQYMNVLYCIGGKQIFKMVEVKVYIYGK
jgi:hypothetical protein